MKVYLPMLVILLLFLSGCVSMDRRGYQELSVEAVDNVDVGKTSCTVKNDDGKWTTLPSRTITISRDSNPLAVKCQTIHS